jgi:hypothetical protein
MSNHEQHNRQTDPPKPPFGDESLIINSRLREIERQQSEDKAAQKKHEASQRTTNWLMTVFTGLLFIANIVSDFVLIKQTNIARENANTAAESVKLTKDLLKGSQAAYFSGTGVMRGYVANDPRPVVAEMDLINKGISIAKGISRKVEFTRETKDGRLLERETHFVHRGYVGSGYGLSEIFPGRSIERGQKISISGFLTFDNGVGETTTQNFCARVIFQGRSTMEWTDCENAEAAQKQWDQLP